MQTFGVLTKRVPPFLAASATDAAVTLTNSCSELFCTPMNIIGEISKENYFHFWSSIKVKFGSALKFELKLAKSSSKFQTI